MPDKRSHMRYITTGCVNLKDESGKLIASNAMLNDISFKGMSLDLKEGIEPGKVVQFELTTELLDRLLIGRGLVKNVVEAESKKGHIFRVGIEFTDIINDDVSSLLNEINRRAREVKKRAGSEGAFDCGAF